MAEEPKPRQKKTETIGFLPMEKAQKLNGWNTLKEATTAFSAAKEASEKARAALRNTIKTKLKLEQDNFDFEETTGNRIRIFWTLEEKGGRTKGKDLSDMF